MKHLILFAVLASSLFICALSIPAVEKAALVDFFNATGGRSWTISSGWCSSADPCTWYGVSCTSDGSHVSTLFLSNNGLSGTIPECIGRLLYLTAVDFSHNRLSGALPVSFGSLRSLYAISMRENQLTGPLDFSRLCLFSARTLTCE